MEPAKLIVSRNSERDLKIRGIEVYLDSQFVGDLTFGKNLELEIEPGPHTLKVTNKLRSKSVDVEVGPGETIRFETAGITMGGLWVLVSFLGVVAYRVTLQQVRPAA